MKSAWQPGKGWWGLFPLNVWKKLQANNLSELFKTAQLSWKACDLNYRGGGDKRIVNSGSNWKTHCDTWSKGERVEEHWKPRRVPPHPIFPGCAVWSSNFHIEYSLLYQVLYEQHLLTASYCSSSVKINAIW